MNSIQKYLYTYERALKALYLIVNHTLAAAFIPKVVNFQFYKEYKEANDAPAYKGLIKSYGLIPY